MRPSSESVGLGSEMRRHAPWMAAILVLGACLFLYRLDADCLAGDEINMLNLAIGERDMELSAGNALIYFPILRQVAAVSTSPFALRLPAVFIGCFGLLVMYWAAALLTGRPRVGLVAALLLAASPYYLMHVQMVHVYSLFFCVATASFALLWTAYHRGERRLWIAWAACLGISLWVHLYMIFVMVAQVLSLTLWLAFDARGAWRRPTRRELGSAVALAGLALLIASPVIVQWILPFGEQLLVKVQGGEPELNPLGHKPPWQISSPQAYTTALTNLLVWRAPFRKVAWLLGGLALLGLAVTAYRRPRLATAWLIWFWVPIPFIVVFAYASGIDLGARRFMFLFPLICLAWALALDGAADLTTWILRRLGRFDIPGLRRRHGALQPLVLAVGSILTALLLCLTVTRYYYQTPQNYDMKTAARLVELLGGPGDLVVPWRHDLFTFYYRGDAKIGSNVRHVRAAVERGGTVWYARPAGLDGKPSSLRILGQLDDPSTFPLGFNLRLSMQVNDPARPLTALDVARTLVALNPDSIPARRRLVAELRDVGSEVEAELEQRRIKRLARQKSYFYRLR